MWYQNGIINWIRTQKLFFVRHILPFDKAKTISRDAINCAIEQRFGTIGRLLYLVRRSDFLFDLYFVETWLFPASRWEINNHVARRSWPCTCERSARSHCVIRDFSLGIYILQTFHNCLFIYFNNRGIASLVEKCGFVQRKRKEEKKLGRNKRTALQKFSFPH